MLILASWADRLFDMPAVLFLIGGVIAVVGILSGAVTKVAVGRSRERTRGWIAPRGAVGTLEPAPGAPGNIAKRTVPGRTPRRSEPVGRRACTPLPPTQTDLCALYRFRRYVVSTQPLSR